MEVICYYILKSSFVLVLFYGIYQLLLRNETLFYFNRIFLLLGLIVSATLPLFYITTTIILPLTQFQATTQVTKNIVGSNLTALSTFLPFYIALYSLGTLIMLARLLRQGIDLRKIFKNGERVLSTTFVHINTKNDIQPFSFFNRIIYNPSLHTAPELNMILAHEKVHVEQYHSLDILLMEVFLALQWLNPIAWLYQIAIKQNLEFIADKENHQVKINKKAYQYILLKQAVGNQHLTIVNPFINSLIKKRIVMINQQQSHTSNALKSVFIIPLLGLFLMSFNTKKVYSISSTNEVITTLNTIEILINKDTTDDELIKIKESLAKEKFDFSYTRVRNNKGEIKNISLHITGGSKKSGEVSSAFNSVSDNDTIDPTFISIDLTKNKITIRNTESGNKMLKIETGNNKQILINTTPKSKHDIEISEEEGNAYIFVDNKQQPLFYLNGVRSDGNAIKNLDKTNIESMNVLKGEMAVEKYGKEGKNGVIEIITKK